MPVRVTKDNVAAVLAAVRGLTGSHVLVGIPQEAEARPDTPLTNAQIGYILDRGSPAANIPPRPWLVPGVRSAQDAILRRLIAGAKLAISGNRQAGEDALHSAGLVAQVAVQTYINSDLPPPLSPRTLAERRRKGRTRTKTLVDTGNLRGSVTYVVRRRGS